MTSVRVVVADDSAVWRKRVARDLGPGFDVVGVSTDVGGTLAQVEALAPDGLVLDVRMPGGGGFAVLERLRERDPRPVVVVVTSFPDPEYRTRSLRLGADAFLDKAQGLAPLASALRAAVAGRRGSADGQVEALDGIAGDAADPPALEARMRLQLAAIDATANAVVITDPSGTILSVNPAFTQLTGYAADEAIGRNPRILKSERTAPATHRDLWKTITSGRVWRGEITNRRKDGTHYDERMTVTPVRDPSGRIESFVAVKEDVTEARRTMEALGLATDVLDHVPDLVLVFDGDGRVRYASPSSRAVLGVEPDTLLGDGWWRLVEPDAAYREQLRDAVARRVLGGEPLPREAFESEVTTAGGATRVLSWRDSHGSAGTLVRVGRDVTPLRAVEHELERRDTLLRHAQRVDTVGRLTGGVAHDFNNLLTVILGETERLIEEAPAEAPLRESLAEIHAAGLRAAALTRQLLVFSRRRASDQTRFTLDELVAGLRKMLRRLIEEHVALHVTPSAGLPPVEADRLQLEQIVVNLVVNGRDAMPGGGTVTLATRVACVDEAMAGRLALRPGQYTVLDVTDTGCGIPPDVLPHVFDPFFSTKPAGQGTGLGLATSLSIARQFGGTITVDTTPGRGTTMSVFMPAASGAGAAPGDDTPDAPRGAERILLVEDDADVRAATARMLRTLGYHVAEAADGEEALALAAALPHLDLLMTDVVMPRMGGRELDEAMRTGRPSVATLFTSGYTGDPGLLAQFSSGHARVLQKPFSFVALASAVRAALDGR